MATSKIPLGNTPIDVTSRLTTTPKTNASTSTIARAMISGNVMQVRGSVKTSAAVNAGTNILIDITGFTPVNGGYIGYFLSGSIFGLMWNNGGDEYALRPLTGNLSSGATCIYSCIFIGELT